MGKVKITLIKSTIGRGKGQTATVEALGLNKIRVSNTVEETPAIQGMINKVSHLVKVEKV